MLSVSERRSGGVRRRRRRINSAVCEWRGRRRRESRSVDKWWRCGVRHVEYLAGLGPSICGHRIPRGGMHAPAASCARARTNAGYLCAVSPCWAAAL
ncbi:hypothetical protein LSTR_LSTR010136 [Laodelphax striatellus]|uniref:Uncharacterized protein n=1 Tax=Laodelphax striatellus TaxID=195883 RepID=A0A482WJH3_LAOST|nr:hypothetical protein LSTR_LSTR010136 [Laodelphax striatellus]